MVRRGREDDAGIGLSDLILPDGRLEGWNVEEVAASDAKPSGIREWEDETLDQALAAFR